MRVQEILQDVTALVGERAGKKHLTLTLVVDPGTPAPAVDDTALKKMCYKVLEHAVTLAPIEGTVHLTAGRKAIGWADRDGVAFVVVNDERSARENGAGNGGFREPDRERTEQATRLLESARTSVEALGGRLWVTNGEEHIQAVTFVLPTGSRRSEELVV